MTRAFAWVLALLVVCAAPAAGQDTDQQASAQEAAMMQAWQAYMTPGEPHQRLAKSVGEWNHTIKMWMDPAAPPTESTGTSTGEMILDGRYLAEEYSGNMMGMPFKGHGLTGYDNAKKKYFNAWIDNMGTGLMTGWGDYDETGKKLTFTGEFVDPMTGENKPYRGVMTWVDDNHTIYQMYMPTPDGSGEFKSLEIHSLRKTS
jgi:hypothetical protein